jgi:hypothetical protein
LWRNADPANTCRNVKRRFHPTQPRALLLQLLLFAVLLFAQGAAYAHLCSHLKAPSEASGQSGTATQLCSQCLVGGPLLGGADAPCAPQVAKARCNVAHVARVASPVVEIRRRYAFRSRAPPSPRA